MFYRLLAVDRQAHVFNHLASVYLHYQHTALAVCCLSELLLREWPKRDGTEKSSLYALFTCYLYRLFCNTCCAAECHYQDLCVVELLCFVAHLVLFDGAVLLL